MYYIEDDKTPIELKSHAKGKARSHYSNLVVLHPNLIFGYYSYFIRYVTQSVITGKIDRSLSNPADKVHYLPVHFEDLTDVVKHAIDNYDQVSGKTFTVNGSEEVNLPELKALLVEQLDGKKDNLINI